MVSEMPTEFFPKFPPRNACVLQTKTPLYCKMDPHLLMIGFSGFFDSITMNPDEIVRFKMRFEGRFPLFRSLLKCSQA